MTDAQQQWDWLEQAAQEAREIIDRLHGEASATLRHDRMDPHSGDTSEGRRTSVPSEPTPSPGSEIEAAAEGGPASGSPGHATS
ncbi:MAG TPA: hypothetical protein VGG05_28695 [Pseudonocardiaceae bacterium]